MRNKILIPLSVLALLVMTGCNAGTTANTNTSANTGNTTASDSQTPVDACSLITADDVSSALGLTVTAHSTAIGSCNLVNDDGVNILLQVVAVNLYSPGQYTGITERTDIGEKAFVQTPIEGRSVSQAYKNSKTFIFNVYSPSAYTTDQVAVLMKVVVGRG